MTYLINKLAIEDTKSGARGKAGASGASNYLMGVCVGMPCSTEGFSQQHQAEVEFD